MIDAYVRVFACILSTIEDRFYEQFKGEVKGNIVRLG